MAINLSAYYDIETALFVKMDVKKWRADSTDAYSRRTFYFSDYYRRMIIDGDEYLPIGELLSITASRSELKATNASVTVVLTGVPNDNLSELLASDLKGSTIAIQRAIMDVNGGLKAIANNPTGRFIGKVSAYTIEDEYDAQARTATCTCALECTSYTEIMSTYVAGRRTNPSDMDKFFSGDTSFDRVPTLVGTNYNFGKTK